MAEKSGKGKPLVTIPETASEKEKALQTALAAIEKQYGKGAVMKLGQNSALNVEAISTGSLSLDIALGIGGVPRGRIIEIFGPESSGKTTVALHIVAEAQKAGGSAVFIDVEHALDPIYARALGVDIDALLVSQPDTGEQALEICEALVRSGAIDVAVVDSVAAMTTKAEIEGEMGDAFVGLQARLMSQALRKLTSVVSKSNAIVIFINQLREKIGIVYGNPETTPGGRALKFYSSVRLDIRKKDTIKEGTDVIGNLTRVKVVKNKVAPPFREAEFDIMYGEGISYEGEVVDLAVKLDILKKSGSWYSYEGNRLGQGRDKIKQHLKDNPDFCKEVAKKVMENKDQLLTLSKNTKKTKGKKGANSNDDDENDVVDQDEDSIEETNDDAPEEAITDEASILETDLIDAEIPPPDEEFSPAVKSPSKLIDIEADDK